MQSPDKSGVTSLERENDVFGIDLRNGSEIHSMPPAGVNRLARDIPPLRASYAPPDETIARTLLATADRSNDAEARIDPREGRWAKTFRPRRGGLGGMGTSPPPCAFPRRGALPL